MKTKQRNGMIVMMIGVVLAGLLFFLLAEGEHALSRAVFAEGPPPELCGGSDAPLQQPMFAEPTVEQKTGPNGSDLIVQNGVYVNRQGEMFGLVVKGLRPRPVVDYTRAMLVCFDQIFTGKVTRTGDQPKARPTPTPAAARFVGTASDLFIQFYRLGFVDPRQADEVAKILVSQPFEEWGALLKEIGALPEQARPEQFRQDYVVDFVIDPPVGRNVRHQYIEKRLSRADVTVEVNSGSVSGGLCWKTTPAPLQTRVVSVTGTRIASLTRSVPTPTTVLFDVGVRGLGSSNKYRLSGRWSALFDAAAPTPVPGAPQCNP